MSKNGPYVWILSAYENSASMAHAFLQMAALKTLAVEWLQLRFFALPSTKNHAP